MLRDELKDSDAAQSGHEPFAGIPFLEVRKMIIKEDFPTLDDKIINKLAQQTRGLNKADIINLIENDYLKNRALSYAPPDSYNTCNPITSSFSERLLSIVEYKKLYNDAGMQLFVYCGFYNQFGSSFKNKLLGIVNKVMGLLGTKGLVITPFILLIGIKETK